MKLLRALTCSAIAALALAVAGCSDDSTPAAAAAAAITPPVDNAVNDPVAPGNVLPDPAPAAPVVPDPVVTDPVVPVVVVPPPVPVPDPVVTEPPADPAPPVVVVPDPVPPTDPVVTPPEDPPVFVPGEVITGQIVKGVTANAIVTAYAPDGDGGFVQLSSTVSSADGAYSLTLPFGFSGVVKIVASASMPPDAPTMMRCDAASGCGSFADANANDVNGNALVDFGEWFQVSDDFSLRAVAVFDGTGFRFVNVTPLSSLASDWAEEFPQGLDEQSALSANTQAAVAFGFALSDLESPLGDITDPLWLNLADPKQVQLSLLMATFAEIAAQNSISSQDVVDTVAALFTGQQGRLREAGDGVGPSIADLLMSMQTVAGVIDLPAATQEEIDNSIASALLLLQDGALNSHPEVTVDRLLARLGPLGEDINELLGVTGLDDPHAFILAQAPYFEWLLSNDNLQLVPLGLDTAIQALTASLYLDMLPPVGTVTLENDGMSTVVLDLVAKKLMINGLRFGQTVDLDVSLSKLSTSIASGKFNYGIVGTVSNDTASGSIDGTLAVDTLDTNFGALINAINMLKLGSPTAIPALKLALANLASTATANVALDGTAQLVRNSDPTQVLSGAVSLEGFVDLGAVAGETIATLDVSSVDLLLPNGDHYYRLPTGAPVLTVRVGDDATVVIDGAATVLGLPEAIGHAEGTLVNARALFEHVRDTLVAQLTADTVDLNVLVTDLMNFDFKQLTLHATGVIDIAGMPSGRDHQYRASLENLTATIYQPHSEDVAMSATLDIDRQAVHFVLGDEPWDLRVLTTPTPRVVLLGPDGQFGEASQEDFYAFLNRLPLGTLLAGINTP